MLRRNFCWIAAVILALQSVSISADEDFRVTLLGTGDPIVRIDRFGPATLVEVGGEKLLFDVGRGATLRLAQLGINPSAIDAVFITHFHSDHVSGIPDLWMTGWVPPPANRRGEKFQVWGPVGVKSMLDNIEQAYSKNTTIRSPQQLLSSGAIQTLAHEFEEEGIVYESNGIKVTAIEVNHSERVELSYGYRVDYQDRAVVISGDTQYDENLISASKGADLLIHEVVLVSDELLASSDRYSRIVGYHTTPEEAGVVFDKVSPKLAVYTHLVMLSTESIPEAPLGDLISRTRKTYSGPLVVGEDLMTFVVGDDIGVYNSASE